MTKGGVHASLDCLGTSATWMPAILSLKTRGRLVRLGLSGQEEQGMLPLPADLLTAREFELISRLHQPQGQGEYRCRRLLRNPSSHRQAHAE